MKSTTSSILLLATAALCPEAWADISTIFTQRDVNVGNNFTNPEQTASSTVPGLFQISIPDPSGGPTGHNFELTTWGMQNTLLTVEQDLLSLTGDLGAGTSASVTGALSSAMYAETYVQAAIYMDISEQSVFSLSGTFSGSGPSTDHYASAILQRDGEVSMRGAIGYFQNGTSNLPVGEVTGNLEPGTYIFQLVLWSNSSAFPMEENQTVSTINSVSVNNFSFDVRTVPEPTSGAFAGFGVLLLGLHRRRTC